MKKENKFKNTLFEPFKLTDISPAIIIFYLIIAPTLIALWLKIFISNIPVVTLSFSFLAGGILLLFIRSLFSYIKRKK
jgi:RsiW-degrading membrane proteinase PrsW (M82 family)